MSTGRDRLLVEAGRVAQERKWQQPAVVSTAELDAEGPVGEPLIVVAPAGELDSNAARSLASLAGAGRVVLLITDEEPPESLRTWLPAGSWIVTRLNPSKRDPLVAAGLREARDRGWQDVTVATAEEVADAGPSGGSLVVTVPGDELTVNLVHSVAALIGAGRHILMVTDAHPEPDVMRWAPQGSLLIADPMDAALDGSNEVASPSAAGTISDEYLSDTEPLPAVPVETTADLRKRLIGAAPRWIQAIADDPDEAARCQCADRTTTAALLRILALDPSAQVRAAAAGNPKTPRDALHAMAERDEDARATLVQAIVDVVTSDPEFSGGFLLAASLNTPREVLRSLSTDPDDEVRMIVAENPNAPSDALQTLATDTDDLVRYNVAANPSASSDVLQTLATDPDEGVLSKVASNPHTPTEVLRSLTADLRAKVRGGLAGNPVIPIHLLVDLVTRPGRNVFTLGEQEGDMGEVLRILACDPDDEVRWGVAKNPNTPADVLASLADDPSQWVRRGVATNPDTPADVLRSLATDTDEWVRRWVADHPHTEADVVQTLLTDRNEWVRRGFAGSPRTPGEVLNSLANDDDLMSLLAENPSTPGDALRNFATGPSEYLRYHVAGNINTPIDVLRSLGADDSLEVQLGLALNPRTPLAVLEQLAEPRVQLEEPDASAQREELGQRLTNSAPEWIQAIAADPNAAARAHAAESTRDWVLIHVLSFDPNPQVRAALTRNPRTPQDVRKLLAEQGG